jgi:putative transposase
MYKLVHAERVNVAVGAACRALDVSRSGYYKWCKTTASAQAQADTKLAVEVARIHAEHRGRYGSPRIHRELRERGVRTSRKRVARLMKQASLSGYTRRRFRHTTDSRHKLRIAPNRLRRNFSASVPNQVWVGDITYIPTVEGWLYLAVLVDLFSRRVIGWAMSDQIDTSLALSALHMAIEQRRPPAGLTHHTDRDCRYASADYQAVLKHHKMKPSMSGKADCWDNAVAESFFATLEKELLSSQPIATRRVTRAAVAGYIDGYYNLLRRHSYIDYSTPLEYELTAA